MPHRSTRIVVVLLACAGALGAWLVFEVERASGSTIRRKQEVGVVHAKDVLAPALRPNERASSPFDSAREAGGALVGPAPAASEPIESRDAFRGLVLDGRTREPLAGVELFWRGAEVEPPAAGACLEPPVARTGADGRFEIRRRSGHDVWLVHAECGALGFRLPDNEIPSDKTTMVPLFEGGGERSFEELFGATAKRPPEFPPDATALFLLHPPTTLELMLDLHRDSPCREMRVQLRELPTPAHDSAPEGIRLFQVTREGRFDAEGRVRFEGVRALAPHTVLLGARDLELALETVPERVSTFAISCGLVPLEGIATDPSGRALEGVALEASSTAPAESDPRANLRLRTDAAGRFGFSSLTTGTWWLHARSEDGRYGALEQVELVDAPVRLRLALAPTLTLTGSVLRADGLPATGDVVARSIARPEHHVKAALDSNGRFRLEVWLDEEFEVSVNGAPDATQRASPGREELLFRVPVPEPPPPDARLEIAPPWRNSQARN